MLLYELAVAFAIGFIAGLVYEAERISRMVATERGLRQFLLVHAPWHLKRLEKQGETPVRVRKEGGSAYMLKIIILATIILSILYLSGLL